MHFCWDGRSSFFAAPLVMKKKRLTTFPAAQGAIDSYSVQAQSPGLPTYSQTPTLETYVQPQVSYAQPPQIASYTQSPPVALAQDTYSGQFTAPNAPPPPPQAFGSSYVEPRTPAASNNVPVVSGYEGPPSPPAPARRRSQGPARAR